MSKLKTLKDIKKSFWDAWFSKEDNIELILSDIKVEAIKWVKMLRKEHNHEVASYFLDFFNLTGEDLK